MGDMRVPNKAPEGRNVLSIKISRPFSLLLYCIDVPATKAIPLIWALFQFNPSRAEASSGRRPETEERTLQIQ